jgi:acetylornithine deacetylase/succinyl-diaminopimelate desuccinylase-like protein
VAGAAWPAVRAGDSLAPARSRLAARDGEIVASQRAIAGIPAPTGAEGERARWLASRLRGAGVEDIRHDGAGNVVARIGGRPGAPAVAVCSHMDTVFPPGTPLALRDEGSRIVGPGINDNARGLAVLLAIAGELARGEIVLPHPVELVGTVGEEGEGDLRGARHYFDTAGRQALAAIALDGPGDERIVHRALGARRYRVEFTGPGGHSWASFGAPNAAHAAAFCAATLGRIALPAEPRASLTVGRMGGGIAVNAIPESAWLEVDIRSTDPALLARLDAEVHAAVREAAREENARATLHAGSLAATLQRIGDRPCGATDAAHPLVRAAIEATYAAGCEPELSLASTDANVPVALGIPAIAIGGGGLGGDAHTLDEWYENADGFRGVARALAIVVAAASLDDVARE